MSESQPNLMQIFIKGLEGKTRTLDVTQQTTIADIKQKLQDDFGGKIEDIRLVYANKELIYLDKETLANLKITNHSTICVITRLKGGVRIKINVNIYESQPIIIEIENSELVSNLKKAIYEKNQQLDSHQMNLYFAGIKMENSKKIEEYKINENDKIIQKKGNLISNQGFLISYEPDVFTEDDNPDEARAKMNCGHVISRDSMTQFLRSVIEARNYIIKCPGYDKNGQICGGVWDFSVCKKIGVLTENEAKEFEDKFSYFYMSQKLLFQECPNCKSFVEKPTELTHNRVYCVFCKIKKKLSQDFCWICLKPWLNNDNTKCGNEDCGANKD